MSTHVTSRPLCPLWWRTVLITVILAASSAAPRSRLSASDPGTGDWPMWRGTPDRNMVSNMKGLPLDWDVKTKENEKWVADPGSQSYGNPVVAGGKALVRTNHGGRRDPTQRGDPCASQRCK